MSACPVRIASRLPSNVIRREISRDVKSVVVATPIRSAASYQERRQS
jgi:hypothetical protein